MGPTPIAELAASRAQAAERLEQAIESAGDALVAYVTSTRALEAVTHQELERYVQNAIVLHLVRAGFGEFVERKLVGPAPSLRGLVDHQHRRSSGQNLRAE